MARHLVRRAIIATTLALSTLATTVGATPAHADVWVGGESASPNVNCDRQSGIMQITVSMTMMVPPAVDDGSILTPAPLPAYHRFWVYSWNTKSWLGPSKWVYTPGTQFTQLTTLPHGYYKVFLQYAWARRTPATTAADWMMATEMVEQDYSHFPYLSTWTPGWCLM